MRFWKKRLKSFVRFLKLFLFLVRELFQVFESTSTGNFHHMEKIVEQLLLRAPVETTRTLIGEELLWKSFNHLHEAPVVDLLIEIFCAGFPKQSDTIQFYKSLVDAKFFDRIGEKIVSPGKCKRVKSYPKRGLDCTSCLRFFHQIVGETFFARNVWHFVHFPLSFFSVCG